MLQCCILFYANYTILATQSGGHGPMAPPLNTPLDIISHQSTFCAFVLMCTRAEKPLSPKYTMLRKMEVIFEKPVRILVGRIRGVSRADKSFEDDEIVLVIHQEYH